MLDNLVSIHPFLAKDDLFDEYRDDPDEFKYEDDVDSNDEDNDTVDKQVTTVSQRREG